MQSFSLANSLIKKLYSVHSDNQGEDSNQTQDGNENPDKSADDGMMQLLESNKKNIEEEEE